MIVRMLKMKVNLKIMKIEMRIGIVKNKAANYRGIDIIHLY